MTRILVFLILLTLQLDIYAQGSNQTSLSNYRTVGVNIHSNGWGLNYSKFFKAKYGSASVLSFDYMNQNYPGERKANDETLRGNPIVINKINNLYFFKAAFGKAFDLSPRSNKSTLGISSIFNIGPMLAIYKPIYIQYSLSDSAVGNVEVVRYDPAIHKANQIESKARFWDGAKKSSSHFGLHAKASIRFDWGSYESNFKAVEAGITWQYIGNAKPLIYSLPTKNMYTGFFIMLSFGRITD